MNSVRPKKARWLGRWLRRPAAPPLSTPHRNEWLFARVLSSDGRSGSESLNDRDWLAVEPPER